MSIEKSEMRTCSMRMRYCHQPGRRQISRWWLLVVVVGISVTLAGAVGWSMPAAWAAGLRRLSESMLVRPFQIGPANRTVISTVAGGGLSVSAPVLTAPMVQPVGVAVDPKGRGYYVLDERDGAGMIRFVNTTGEAITIARVVIGANSINLLAGGGIGNESQPAREVDLGQVTGLAIDPGGEALYLLTPQTNSVRVLNVGSENFSFLRRTIAPGRVASVFNIGRTEARALAVRFGRAHV